MKAGRFLTTAALNFSLTLSACAQSTAPPPASPSSASTGVPASAPASAPAQGDKASKTFSQQELDQLLAPVALYPDDLLAQVLMASTYPLDVVMADRWIKANPKLKGKELEDALQKQPWDPSVKSLTVFPQVLTMMSEKIDWTQKLGDAFLAQQKDVMATAQALRKKAADQGNLKDSKEQKVVTEQTGSTTIIKIEPTNPEVVYVPTYNPTVVYGSWPYPAYPPYYYYPPGYAAGAAFFGFTAGAIVGSALWGGCNWGGGSVNVNVNRYNNFNRSNISSGSWNHNAARRGAVPYRDQRVAQQYGRGQSANAASREQFRGRADTSRTSLQSGNAGNRDIGGGRDGAGRDAGNRDIGGGRDGAGRDAGNRDIGGGREVGDRNVGSRDAGGSRNASAFDTGRGGSQTRDMSNRGSSSLSSARSSGNLGGGSRGGGFSGGGARAGGGGFGGGGRGGGRR
ncbi:DUF3300 domain-containing protein [Herbaspirillum sp. HC18]|nr:DUF3300 domain-containing protein [Herbaspirillum sp. HC18]